MEVNPLIPIGAIVKVDKSKIKKSLPSKLLDDLPQIINGKIVDYKMTDGMDIGYVLMTESNLKIWIFNTELNEQTRKEYKIEDKNKSNNLKTNNFLIGNYKVAYEINGNRNFKTILNPFNLASWLIFSLKDVF